MNKSLVGYYLNEVYKYIIGRLIQYFIIVIHFINVIHNLYTDLEGKIYLENNFMEDHINRKMVVYKSFPGYCNTAIQFLFSVSIATSVSNVSLRNFILFDGV